MADILTAEERALIDGAVAAGQVTKCPTSAVLTGVPVDGVLADFSTGSWRERAKNNRQKIDYDRFDRLCREGKTNERIAAVFGVTQNYVAIQRRQRGMTPEPKAEEIKGVGQAFLPPPQQDTPKRAASLVQRRAAAKPDAEAVRKLGKVERLAPTMTTKELAAEFDVTETGMGNYLRRHGIKPKPAPTDTLKPERRAQLEKRDTEILERAADHTVAEIVQTMDLKEHTVRGVLYKHGVSAKSVRGKADRNQRIIDLAPTHTAQEIADSMDLSTGRVRVILAQAGVDPKAALRGQAAFRSRSGDKAAERKVEKQAEKVQKIRDRRRFKTAATPIGEPSVLVPADTTGTQFPGRVFDVSDDESALKDGCNSAKIGGDVLVGWLKGARIYTLTLEERATCPRSCPMWRGCYGNAMHYARRWRHGAKLEAALRDEVAYLCETFGRVLIRLHVLGDFYSADYVRMWGELLAEHDGLNVFGFTAHTPESEMGKLLSELRAAHGNRFAIRHSGRTGSWGSFTIDFPTARKRIGDAVVCPEQLDAMAGGAKGTHCGSCAACWSCDAPIVFVEH